MSHEWCEVSRKIDTATVVTMSRRGVREHSTKRNDRTFHRRNATPCTTHHYTPTNTARAGALMFHHPAWVEHHGWVPVNTHSTPVLTSVRRLWVARPRARASDTHTSDTKCEQHGWRPNSLVAEKGAGHRNMVAEHPHMAAHPQHGSGAELRTTAVNNEAQAQRPRNIGSRTSPSS